VEVLANGKLFGGICPYLNPLFHAVAQVDVAIEAGLSKDD
jgi:hypothetical protein